jgi:hypothetical protein
VEPSRNGEAHACRVVPPTPVARARQPPLRVASTVS